MVLDPARSAEGGLPLAMEFHNSLKLHRSRAFHGPGSLCLALEQRIPTGPDTETIRARVLLLCLVRRLALDTDSAVPSDPVGRFAMLSTDIILHIARCVPVSCRYVWCACQNSTWPSAAAHSVQQQQRLQHVAPDATENILATSHCPLVSSPAMIGIYALLGMRVPAVGCLPQPLSAVQRGLPPLEELSAACRAVFVDRQGDSERVRRLYGVALREEGGPQCYENTMEQFASANVAKLLATDWEAQCGVQGLSRRDAAGGKGIGCVARPSSFEQWLDDLSCGCRLEGVAPEELRLVYAWTSVKGGCAPLQRAVEAWPEPPDASDANFLMSMAPDADEDRLPPLGMYQATVTGFGGGLL